MSAALLIGAVASLGLAAAAAWAWRRTRPAASLLLILAAGWPVVVGYGPLGLAHGPLPVARLADGLGGLALTRAAAGLLVMTAAAAVLRRAGRAAAGGRRTLAVELALAPVAILAASSRGLVPLALLLALVPLGVVGRWAVVGGPGRLRSVATRTVALGAGGLLAGAALAPTVPRTGTSAHLVGLVVAVALAALVGLLPFAPWAVLGRSLAAAEGDLGLTWAAPVGLLGTAILLAGEPRAVAAELQILLTALGLATAVVWGAVAAIGPVRIRVPAVQGADVGLMVVGLASGRLDGLLGALLLLVLDALLPAALAAGAARPARAAGWLAAGGLPPLGAFPGRLLVLAAASTIAFLPTALVTVAMGLLLIGGARGALGGHPVSCGPDGDPPVLPPGRASAGVGWIAAGAALLTGPLGPFLVPLVYGVRW